MSKIKIWFKENLFFLIFVVITFIICNIRLPYYIMAPGGVIDVDKRIKLDDKNEMSGTLDLLYVSEYKATVSSVLLSFILKDWDLNKLEDVKLNDESVEEIDLRNKVMLDNSYQNAIFVAYNKAGKEIKINDSKNIVVATTIDNNLEIGDEIISVNGIDIYNVEQLKEIINNSEVNSNLNIKLIRNNKEMNVNSKVIEENGNKVIGIVMVTNYDYELDPEIDISFKSSEGGSSGGLMLALNIYNAISDVDITYSHRIAGTGTIDLNGNVGEIDGVKYKIIGAYKNKMELVFVPVNNYEEAKSVVEDRGYDMKVVAVKTIDEAIDYLNNTYGNN